MNFGGMFGGGWMQMIHEAVEGDKSRLFNYYGARQQNRYNKRMQQRDQAWREYMRSTNYQATVEDLRKAGLNPLLAVGGPGPSGTPGGSSGGSAGMMRDTDKKVSGPLEVMAMEAGVENVRAQTNSAKSLAKANDALAELRKEQKRSISAMGSAASWVSEGLEGMKGKQDSISMKVGDAVDFTKSILDAAGQAPLPGESTAKASAVLRKAVKSKPVGRRAGYGTASNRTYEERRSRRYK